MPLDHDHGAHGGHSHSGSENTDAKWLTVALAINVSFMVVEAVAGAVQTRWCSRSHSQA